MIHKRRSSVQGRDTNSRQVPSNTVSFLSVVTMHVIEAKANKGEVGGMTQAVRYLDAHLFRISPWSCRVRSRCDIRVTIAYLPQVSLGTHL